MPLSLEFFATNSRLHAIASKDVRRLLQIASSLRAEPLRRLARRSRVASRVPNPHKFPAFEARRAPHAARPVTVRAAPLRVRPRAAARPRLHALAPPAGRPPTHPTFPTSPTFFDQVPPHPLHIPVFMLSHLRQVVDCFHPPHSPYPPHSPRLPVRSSNTPQRWDTSRTRNEPLPRSPSSSTACYHSKTTEIISFVVRLAVRVESAIAFLLQLSRGEHPSLTERSAPGLHVSAPARVALDARFAEYRAMMMGLVVPMLLGWLEELEDEEEGGVDQAAARSAPFPQQVDQLCREMSKPKVCVRAHLVLALTQHPARAAPALRRRAAAADVVHVPPAAAHVERAGGAAGARDRADRDHAHEAARRPPVDRAPRRRPRTRATRGRAARRSRRHDGRPEGEPDRRLARPAEGGGAQGPAHRGAAAERRSPTTRLQDHARDEEVPRALYERVPPKGAAEIQALLHDVFEAGTGDAQHEDAWSLFEGPTNAGRFAATTFRLLPPEQARRAPLPRLDRVSDRDPPVEVNIQLLQVTMRGQFLMALDKSIAGDDDMVELFGNSTGTVQCTMTGNYEHMQERAQFASYPFKLQLWTPDRRLPAQPPTGMLMLGRQYAAAELAKHEMWVAEAFEPVRNQYFVRLKKGPLKWYFPEGREMLPARAQCCQAHLRCRARRGRAQPAGVGEAVARGDGVQAPRRRPRLLDPVARPPLLPQAGVRVERQPLAPRAPARPEPPPHAVGAVGAPRGERGRLLRQGGRVPAAAARRVARDPAQPHQPRRRRGSAAKKKGSPRTRASRRPRRSSRRRASSRRRRAPPRQRRSTTTAPAPPSRTCGRRRAATAAMPTATTAHRRRRGRRDRPADRRRARRRRHAEALDEDADDDELADGHAAVARDARGDPRAPRRH